jgi:hypothetical protein
MSHFIIKIHLTFIFIFLVIGNQIINLTFHLFLLEFISINEKCGTIFFSYGQNLSYTFLFLKFEVIWNSQRFK